MNGRNFLISLVIGLVIGIVLAVANGFLVIFSAEMVGVIAALITVIAVMIGQIIAIKKEEKIEANKNKQAPRQKKKKRTKKNR